MDDVSTAAVDSPRSDGRGPVSVNIDEIRNVEINVAANSKHVIGRVANVDRFGSEVYPAKEFHLR